MPKQNKCIKNKVPWLSIPPCTIMISGMALTLWMLQGCYGHFDFFVNICCPTRGLSVNNPLLWLPNHGNCSTHASNKPILDCVALCCRERRTRSSSSVLYINRLHHLPSHMTVTYLYSTSYILFWLKNCLKRVPLWTHSLILATAPSCSQSIVAQALFYIFLLLQITLSHSLVGWNACSLCK